MPKEEYPIIPKQSGHIGQKINDDLEKTQSSTILQTSRASGSVRF
jgi:hypothetical protein